MPVGPFRDAAPEGHRTHPWATVNGECPSCGQRPDGYRGHKVTAQTPDRILVECRSKDAKGCGAQWAALSHQAHKLAHPPRWADTYGPPLVWAVVLAIGATAGSIATLAVLWHP